MCVFVIPNMRQIIWSAALKQKGSGPVYSHGETERENDTMQFVGLSSAHSSTLLYGRVKVVN